MKLKGSLLETSKRAEIYRDLWKYCRNLYNLNVPLIPLSLFLFAKHTRNVVCVAFASEAPLARRQPRLRHSETL